VYHLAAGPPTRPSLLRAPQYRTGISSSKCKQAKSQRPQTALFLSQASGSGETHFLLAAFPPSVAPAERVPVEMLYMN